MPIPSTKRDGEADSPDDSAPWPMVRAVQTQAYRILQATVHRTSARHVLSRRARTIRTRLGRLVAGPATASSRVQSHEDDDSDPNGSQDLNPDDGLVQNALHG